MNSCSPKSHVRGAEQRTGVRHKDTGLQLGSFKCWAGLCPSTAMWLLGTFLPLLHLALSLLMRRLLEQMELLVLPQLSAQIGGVVVSLRWRRARMLGERQR